MSRKSARKGQRPGAGGTDSAGIVLKPGPYYVGMWFVGHDERRPVHQRQDWLCCVWREQDAGDWQGRYRISRHVSAGLRKDGAPADRRSWVHFEIEAALSEDTVIEQIERIATALAGVNEVPVNSVLIQGDYLKALALLETQDWCHQAPGP